MIRGPSPFPAECDTGPVATGACTGRVRRRSEEVA